MAAPKKSIRPKKRPDDLMEGEAVKRGNRAAKRAAKEGGYAAGGSVQKYASGGKCRGMGAAKRGGNYKG